MKDMLCIRCIQTNMNSNWPLIISTKDGESFAINETQSLTYYEVPPGRLVEVIGKFPISEGFIYRNASNNILGIYADTQYKGDLLCFHHALFELQKDGR